MIRRTYSELIKLKSFKERYDYLYLGKVVFAETFGHQRYLNQIIYKTQQWKHTRAKVIVRDLGCDLGIEGRDITGKILVHHMNPLTIEDILNNSPNIYDPEGLITTHFDTHNAIHYKATVDKLGQTAIERYANDTCPWR